MALRRKAVPAAGAPVAALARLRQGSYRLLSRSLLAPQKERLEGLGVAVQELARRGRRGQLAGYYPCWNEFLDTMESFAAQDIPGLQTQYARGFFASPKGALCPLYESSCSCNSEAAQGWLLAQLAMEYAQAGVAPSPHSGQPEDHAAVELEFMGYLCSMEAEDWEQEDVSQALQSLSRQAEFLQRHLTRCLPVVAGSLECCPGGPMYGRILMAAAVFVLNDSDIVQALCRRFQGWSTRKEVFASVRP